MTTRTRLSALLGIAGLIGLITAPFWLSAYWVKMLVYMLWIIYLACAWHLPLRGGMFSLMHGLFLGAGAYTSALLFIHFNISPWLGMVAGVAVTVLLAVPTGWLVLRGAMSQVTFAAMTLAFSMIAVFIVHSITAIGGTRGIAIPTPAADDPANFQWVGVAPYYYIILVLAVGALGVSHCVMKSRLGLRLRASAQNPRLASLSGVNLLSTRMAVFVISAVLFSIAGTFWAQYSHFVKALPLVGPETIIPVALMVNIGGVGTTWGPVLGPALMVPLVWVARLHLGSRFPGIEMLLYGIVGVLVLRFLGTGLLLWPKQYRARAAARGEARRSRAGVTSPP